MDKYVKTDALLEALVNLTNETLQNQWQFEFMGDDDAAEGEKHIAKYLKKMCEWVDYEIKQLHHEYLAEFEVMQGMRNVLYTIEQDNLQEWWPVYGWAFDKAAALLD